MYMLTPYKDSMYVTDYTATRQMPIKQTTFKREKFVNQCKIDELILNNTIFQEDILHYARQRLISATTNAFKSKMNDVTIQTPLTWLDHLKQDCKLIRKIFGEPRYKTHTVSVNEYIFRKCDKDSFVLLNYEK